LVGGTQMQASPQQLPLLAMSSPPLSRRNRRHWCSGNASECHFHKFKISYIPALQDLSFLHASMENTCACKFLLSASTFSSITVQPCSSAGWLWDVWSLLFMICRTARIFC